MIGCDVPMAREMSRLKPLPVDLTVTHTCGGLGEGFEMYCRGHRFKADRKPNIFRCYVWESVESMVDMAMDDVLA